MTSTKGMKDTSKQTSNSKDKGQTKNVTGEKKKDSCLGLLAFYSFFVMGTAVLSIALIVQRMPSKIDPIHYEMPEPPSLTGHLSMNELLKSSTMVLEDVLNGPESFVFHKNHLYTGTSDGKIMKINQKMEATVFSKFGSGENITTLGRPLGMRLSVDKKSLLVADAYLGLFKVDLSTGKHQKVFPFDNDFKVTFFDDLDILPNGDVIVSEASVKFHYHDVTFEALESRGNGRLLKINLKDKTYEVIKSGLFFPNGVQRDLTGTSDSVLVAESFRNRILRIFVNGPKKGKYEMFAENLPGGPDNLRESEKGDGYWVALGGICSKEKTCHSHIMREVPFVRSVIAKLVPPSILLKASDQYSIIVKLDINGRIVESLHDTNRSVLPVMTQVTEHAGALFIGNFNSVGLGYLNRDCTVSKTCFFNK